eukprot:365145-Chlamydomonas_euryale.AAC.11
MDGAAWVAALLKGPWPCWSVLEGMACCFDAIGRLAALDGVGFGGRAVRLFPLTTPGLTGNGNN